MDRSWDECVASSRRARARYDNAQFIIGNDAAEAIPPGTNGVDTGITEKIKRYAEEVGVEFPTLDRWRSIAIDYRRVMKFPPAGGFSKVNYSVYRELHDLFGKEPEKAFAALKAIVAVGEPPTKSGRWTWTAVQALWSAETPLSTGASDNRRDDSQAGESGAETEKEASEGAVTGRNLDEALQAVAVAAAAKTKKRKKTKKETTPTGDGSGVTTRKPETAEARVEAYLQQAWNEIPNISREAFGPEFESFKDHVEIALSQIKATRASLERAGAAA